ncbi:MAG: cytochrome C [Nitrosomonadales bacterium]|nr:cytochrome C [Nitrosomonadales bacterium]
MRKILLVVFTLAGMGGSNLVFAAGDQMQHHDHHHGMSMMDTRISLGLSAEMKQHQLSNMREHTEAIHSIIGLMSENNLEEAAKIARSKLGLTPEMRKMCSMMGGEKFMTLGIAFHKSGDDLGDALQTGDVNKSLRALNKTMQYCVECHATYRQ